MKDLSKGTPAGAGGGGAGGSPDGAGSPGGKGGGKAVVNENEVAFTFKGIDITMKEVAVQDKIIKLLRGPPPIPYTLFLKWDVDHSGKITPDELEAAVADMGITCKASTVYSLFDAFDEDNSGVLDYQELYRKLTNGKTMMEVYGKKYKNKAALKKSQF